MAPLVDLMIRKRMLMGRNRILYESRAIMPFFAADRVPCLIIMPNSLSSNGRVAAVCLGCGLDPEVQISRPRPSRILLVGLVARS